MSNLEKCPKCRAGVEYKPVRNPHGGTTLVAFLAGTDDVHCGEICQAHHIVSRNARIAELEAQLAECRKKTLLETADLFESPEVLAETKKLVSPAFESVVPSMQRVMANGLRRLAEKENN